MGLAGLLCVGGQVQRRLDVFLDYQNVHLTAHQTWCAYGAPLHQCLIDPLALALELERMFDGAQLQRCFAYRGRPDPRKQPQLAKYNDRQSAWWSKDARISVRSRPLRYPRDWGATGAEPPREKGVDVQLSVELIERTIDAEFDIAVVFTHDTDMIPALELAARRSATVIVANWLGANRLQSTSHPFPGVGLPFEAFARAQDTRDYSY